MEWERVEDTDDSGNYRVSYRLLTPPGYDFAIRATVVGVQLTGTTPYYTDWTAVNQKIQFAQYIHQVLKERGLIIPQQVLDRGEIL